jgi:hypothetical protein
MKQTYRVVGLKDGDVFVAQVLEVDVSAQGSSFDEALERLKVALNAEGREAELKGRDIQDLLRPAPKIFHDLYEDHPQYREKLVA